MDPETFSVRVRTLRELTVAVRDARRAAGMTQAELAAATGLTRSWISQFEHGRAPRASLDRILVMLRALDIRTTLTYPVPPLTPTSKRVKSASRPEHSVNHGNDHPENDDDDESGAQPSQGDPSPVRLADSLLEKVRARRAGYLRAEDANGHARGGHDG